MKIMVSISHEELDFAVREYLKNVKGIELPSGVVMEYVVNETYIGGQSKKEPFARFKLECNHIAGPYR